MNLRNPSMAQNQMLGLPGSFMQTSPPGRQTMPMSGNGANPQLNMHPGAVNPGTMLGQGYPMSNNAMMQGRGPARPPQGGQPMINGHPHMNPSNQLGAGAIGFSNGIPNQMRRAVSQPQNPMGGMAPGVNGNMGMGITTPSSVPPQMRPSGPMQQPGMRPGMHMALDSAMSMPGSRPVPAGPAGVNRPGGTVPIMSSLGPNPMPHQQNNFSNMAMPHSSSPRPGGPNPGMPIGQHSINRARTTPDNSNAFMAGFGAPSFPSGAGASPGRMPGNNNYPMIPSTSPNQMSDMSHSMGNAPNGTPSRAEFNPTPAQQLHSMHPPGAGADFPVGPPFAIPQPPSQHNHAAGNPMPSHHPQSQSQSQPQNPSQQQRPRSSQQSHPSTPQQQPQTSHSQPPSHHASPHSDMNNMYPRPQSQPQNQQQQQQGGLGQPSSSGPGPIPGPGSQTQTPRQNPPHPHPHPGPHSHQHPSVGPNIGRIGPPGAQQPPQQGQGQGQQGGPVPNGVNMMGNMGMGSNMGAVGMGPGGMRPPSSSGHPPGQQPIAPRPPSNIFPNVSAPGPGPGPGPHPHSHQQQQQQQQPHQGGQPGGPSHGPSSSQGQGQGQGLGPGQGHGPGPGPNPNPGMNMNVDTSPPSSSPTDPSQPQPQTQGPQPVQGPAPPGQGPHQGLQGQPGQGQQGQVGAVARPLAGNSTPALGHGVGLIRLLQFSGILANENKQKLQLAWWNDLIREYFTPKAIMRFTLWKDNQRNEAKPFEIGVPILPRFFLVTTQSGVKSMTLTLDGARERLYAYGHAVVECVSAVWTYKYANGYTVALRGPLTVHVVLTAPPPPGTAGANGPSPNGAGMHPQGIGGGNYLLKFEDFQFDAMQHDKYIALESIMGPRSMESPRTPRSRHPIPPGPLGVNGMSGDDLVGGAVMGIGGGMGGGGGIGDDDDRKWEEPRVMIEKGFIPGEPVNAFGIPQATMRCLELAESVAQMSDLIAFSSDSNLGPIESLKNMAQKIRESMPPFAITQSPMVNGIGHGLQPSTQFTSMPSLPNGIGHPTLYTSAPSNVVNPGSSSSSIASSSQAQSQQGQTPSTMTSTMSSPQNLPNSANSSPRKGHKTVPSGAGASTSGGVTPSATPTVMASSIPGPSSGPASASTPGSSSTTNTPAMANASLKRKQVDSPAQAGTDGGTQKRSVRKRKT